MSYIDKLSAIQKQNANILVDRMKAKGITNPFTHAAILAVVSKESAFLPKSENLNYTAQRIQQVWPNIPAATAVKLANNPQALGDYVYGPAMNKTLGNGPGEGYKYRGRGYNQITGKSNMKIIGDQIGVDLVNNPDALNDPINAADAAIVFFQNGINAMAKQGKLAKYNATNINDFKTAQDSLGAIYNVNAGVGSSQAKLDADVTGGKAAATSRLGDLYAYLGNKVTETTQAANEVVKKNPKTTIIVTAGLILGLYLLINALKSNK